MNSKPHNYVQYKENHQVSTENRYNVGFISKTKLLNNFVQNQSINPK